MLLLLLKMAVVVSKKLRKIQDPFLVAAPTATTIVDRLKLSGMDEAVLRQVGSFLGVLERKDFVERSKLGLGLKHEGRKERKQKMTFDTTSRIAGSVTGSVDDKYERGYRNLADERKFLHNAIRKIRQRLSVPVGEKEDKTKGYRDKGERWFKQQRLAKLEARLVKVDRKIASGCPSVVFGSKTLLKNRLHLKETSKDLSQWRLEWDSARMFLTFAGDKDGGLGNQSFKIDPATGDVKLRLPNALSHLSNVAGKTPYYVFSCKVFFNYKRDQWAAQVLTGAVGYKIVYKPDRDKWYVHASWTLPVVAQPAIEYYDKHRTLAIDFNADHLACRVILPDGNVLGQPHRIFFVLEGSSERRLGVLRQTILDAIDYGMGSDCRSLTVENLGFTDSRHTGRETMGRGRKGKRFRATVSGMPTSKFRNSVSSMCFNKGLGVVAVDPAYTSKWGRQNWKKHLDNSFKTEHTVHDCAAVVIGRRGKSLSGRCGSVGSQQCMEEVQASKDMSERPGELPVKPPRLLPRFRVECMVEGQTNHGVLPVEGSGVVGKTFVPDTS